MIVEEMCNNQCLMFLQRNARRKTATLVGEGFGARLQAMPIQRKYRDRRQSIEGTCQGDPRNRGRCWSGLGNLGGDRFEKKFPTFPQVLENEPRSGNESLFHQLTLQVQVPESGSWSVLSGAVARVQGNRGTTNCTFYATCSRRSSTTFQRPRHGGSSSKLRSCQGHARSGSSSDEQTVRRVEGGHRTNHQAHQGLCEFSAQRCFFDGCTRG